MRKKITVFGVSLLGVFSIWQSIDNVVLLNLNKELENRDSLRKVQLIESRHETRVYREFMQKSNNITKDCYKCRQKVLFELSEDFEKFEILTRK